MMDLLKERIQQSAVDFRDWKHDAVEPEWRAPASDLPIRLEMFVGDRPYCLAIAANRDEALYATRIARLGLGIDCVVFGMDAHMKKMSEEDLDRDGPPPPGSLQQACHDEGACERGEISDVLVLHAVTPETDLTTMMPYALVPEKPHVEWAETSEAQPDDKIEGLIIGTLRDWMRLPPLSVTIDALLNDGERRAEAEKLEWKIRTTAIGAMREVCITLALFLTVEERALLIAADPAQEAAMTVFDDGE